VTDAARLDKFITDKDRAVYAGTGYGGRTGYGARPAVLVVDVNYNFTGDRDMPIVESIKTWRNSCGDAGWPRSRRRSGS